MSFLSLLERFEPVLSILVVKEFDEPQEPNHEIQTKYSPTEVSRNCLRLCLPRGGRDDSRGRR